MYECFSKYCPILFNMVFTQAYVCRYQISSLHKLEQKQTENILLVICIPVEIS